ncbi:hypothetical protein AB1N83_011937 [Pleurotus pulmonarius]
MIMHEIRRVNVVVHDPARRPLGMESNMASREFAEELWCCGVVEKIVGAKDSRAARPASWRPLLNGIRGYAMGRTIGRTLPQLSLRSLAPFCGQHAPRNNKRPPTSSDSCDCDSGHQDQVKPRLGTYKHGTRLRFIQSVVR